MDTCWLWEQGGPVRGTTHVSLGVKRREAGKVGDDFGCFQKGIQSSKVARSPH